MKLSFTLLGDIGVTRNLDQKFLTSKNRRQEINLDYNLVVLRFLSILSILFPLPRYERNKNYREESVAQFSKWNFSAHHPLPSCYSVGIRSSSRGGGKGGERRGRGNFLSQRAYLRFHEDSFVEYGLWMEFIGFETRSPRTTTRSPLRGFFADSKAKTPRLCRVPHSKRPGWLHPFGAVSTIGRGPIFFEIERRWVGGSRKRGIMMSRRWLLNPFCPLRRKETLLGFGQFRSSGCLLVFYSSIDREEDFLIGEYYGLDSFVWIYFEKFELSC